MNNSNLLNRFFSKSTLKQCIEGAFPSNLGIVLSRCQLSSENLSNYQVISEIYKFLGNEHRNEYFYKNTLLNELLVNSPIHSLDNTSAIIELPVDSSKLDFLLINGKAVVYEIKTELDNFERLIHQINDYYRAFNNVVIITSPSSVEKLNTVLIDFPNVGISIINEYKKIEEIKCPMEYNLSLSLRTIFKILRKSEFENILLTLNVELPKVSQFEYYRTCEELFCSQDLNAVYPLFLKQLKSRTKILKEEFLRIPYELKSIAYFSKLKNNEYEKLSTFLNSYSVR